MPSTGEVPSIKKLDAAVINRIAAGEVVQRPSAAIKELLENSIDAGSTTITVTVKSGGLDSFQITDNGHGIRKEDLPIVCERFTTSKLTRYDDLRTIQSFGFRGEALASISHVAQVTILTRTADSQCAFRARYKDGKLVPLSPGEKSDPKPCAGVVGTSIIVEDLFYNMPTRKAAFKNHNEEYQRILDVVTRYSVLYADKGVGFVCKKHGQTVPDLHTPAGASTADVIKQVFGVAVSRELLDLQFTHENYRALVGPPSHESDDVLAYNVKGKVTNANYSQKKGQLLLFINHRLVESAGIRKAVDGVYCDLLPKHAHPFVFLSIEMPGDHVDVNVHPTKREVHFLFEDAFLDQLAAMLRHVLDRGNESRTFKVQTILPPALYSQPAVPADQPASTQRPPSRMQDEAEWEESRHVEMVVATRPAAPSIPLSTSFPRGPSPRREGLGLGSQAMPTHRQVETAVTGSAPPPARNAERERGTEEVEEGEERKEEANEGEEGREEEEEEDDETRGEPRRGNGDAWLGAAYSARSETEVAPRKRRSESDDTPSKRPNKFVRVDPRTQRIDTFFRTTSDPSPPRASPSPCPSPSFSSLDPVPTAAPASQGEEIVVLCQTCAVAPQPTPACPCCTVPPSSSSSSFSAAAIVEPALPATAPAFELRLTSCQLTSVLHLVDELRGGTAPALCQRLRDAIFVGCVDARLSLVQCGSQLLLCQHQLLLRQFFRQLCLFQFAEFHAWRLEPPLDVRCCLLAAAMPAAESSLETLASNAAMLLEYFAIGLEKDDNGQLVLTSVPVLWPGYSPWLALAPLFLSQLAAANYTEERACFDSVAQSLADWYCQLSVDCSASSASSLLLSAQSEECLRSVLLPAMKKHLLAQCDDTVFVELTSLEKLYRIFERC